MSFFGDLFKGKSDAKKMESAPPSPLKPSPLKTAPPKPAVKPGIKPAVTSPAVKPRSAAEAAKAPSAAAPAAAQAAKPKELALDEIVSVFQSIEEAIGMTDGAGGGDAAADNLFAVSLPLSEMIKILPSAFAIKPEALPPSETTEIIVEDLFAKLQHGKVETSMRYFMAGVSKQYLSAKADVNSKAMITLPLKLIVSAVDPADMKKRMSSVSREQGIHRLPNLFSGIGDAKPTKPVQTIAPPMGPAEKQAAAAAKSPAPPTPAEAKPSKPAIPLVPEAPASKPPSAPPPAPEASAVKPQEAPMTPSAPASAPAPKPAVAKAPAPPAETKPAPAPAAAPRPTLKIALPAKEPTAPVAPSAPEKTPPISQPSEPIKPIAQAEPVKPTERIKPTEPVKPAEPIKPAASAAPKPAFKPPVEVKKEAGPVLAPKAEVQAPPAPTPRETMKIKAPVAKPAPKPTLKISPPAAEEPSATPELPQPPAPPAKIVLGDWLTAAPKAPPVPGPVQEAKPSAAALQPVEPPVKPVEAPAAVQPAPKPVAAAPEPPPAESGHVPDVLLKGVNINLAGVPELTAAFKDMSDRLAQRIVDERMRNGPFFDVIELARVAGVRRRIFERLTGEVWKEDLYNQYALAAKAVGKWEGGRPRFNELAARFSMLDGFEGCAIVHEDGELLALSGEERLGKPLAAIAPQIVKRAEQYLQNLGDDTVYSTTLTAEKRCLTFTQCNNICFVALHERTALNRKHLQIANGVGLILGRRLKGMTKA